MIRLYPSGLEGEPLETHVIEAPILLVDWLKQQAPDFSLEREHPICIKVEIYFLIRNLSYICLQINH